MSEQAIQTDNSTAFIGHNNPPEGAFEIAKDTVETTLNEARAWLDENKLETQTQADYIGTLLGCLREASKELETARKEEKTPLDKAVAEIQARYKPLSEKLKKAQDFCKQRLAVYLQEQEDLRLKAEEEARIEAEEKAKAALDASQSIQSFEDIEEATNAIDHSKEAAKTLKDIESHKVSAKGSKRRVSFRTKRTPEITDFNKALSHYSRTNPDAFEELLFKLAAQDIRSGVAEIDGFKINEGKVVV